MQSIHDTELGDIAIKIHWNARKATARITGGHIVITIPASLTGDDVRRIIETHRTALAEMMHRAQPAVPADGTIIRSAWLTVTVQRADTQRITITRHGTGYTVTCPGNCSKEDIIRAAKACLRNRAGEVLPDMLARLARQHGFRFSAVRINSANRRWGSCSSKGNINLSAALMTLPPHLVEFVLLHELCHTRQMNHGKAFKDLLDRCCDGRMRELEKELKRHHPPG